VAGRDNRVVPGAEPIFFAVVHGDLHSSGQDITHVGGLPAIRLGDRLEVHSSPYHFVAEDNDIEIVAEWPTIPELYEPSADQTLICLHLTSSDDRAGVTDRLSVEAADICALPYEDGYFDRVVADAVTMFVDRDRAIAELVRVCRPDGLVLATEFHWQRPPTVEARHAFLSEVCPGMLFDTLEDWLARYRAAGLVDLQVTTGPFEMMTAHGFISDEGFGNAIRVMARALTNGTARRRMTWMMPRISKAVPFLGYVLICGRRA